MLTEFDITTGSQKDSLGESTGITERFHGELKGFEDRLKAFDNVGSDFQSRNQHIFDDCSHWDQNQPQWFG